MPLKIVNKINEHSSWALWEIEEEIGTFFLNVDLTKEEKSAYDLISNHYKKLEWLATRATARKLLDTLNLPYEGIFKDSHGKPHLNGSIGEISVTHSYPYVAVIFHKKEAVGIDLEKPRDKILKIAKKFLNDEEMAFSKHDIKKITILWSVKESLYKLHGRKFVVFKDNLEAKPFELEKEGLIQGVIKLNADYDEIKLQYICYEDFIITYTIR